MRVSNWIAPLLVFLILGSCTKSEFLSEGDFFHLNHKGANMPVWVNGNFDSDVMIITVHGGPGDSGMGFSLSKGFENLEEDYLLCYWDQRYSGMTQGRYDKATMHPDQFIEDLSKVVTLVQEKYGEKSYFILGHSWGGQLSAGYLGRNNNDDKFKGWIDLNGSIYGDLESQLMKEWILERVPDELAEPDADIEYWQYIIDWYEENPAPGNYSAFQPYAYAIALGGDVYDLDKYLEENKIPYSELIFKSMFSLSFYNNSFSDSRDQVVFDEINYTPELAEITIPSLMLWGADDGIVPAKVADYVYENLGTLDVNKRVVKIAECAHGPQNEHPEVFYQEINDFVNAFK